MDLCHLEKILKWIKLKCKEQNKNVKMQEEELERVKQIYIYDSEYCIIEEADRILAREKGKLQAYVDVKIKIERYIKELKLISGL